MAVIERSIDLPARTYLLLVAGLIVIVSAIAFPLTFVARSNVVIGILLMPFVVIPVSSRRINWLYLLLSILFIAATWHFHVRMFFFFGMGFLFLFLFEKEIGAADPLMLILMLLMSPFFWQVSSILGFGFRMQLSAWAGNILSSIGTNIVVEGNTMMVDGNAFTVDDACAGLSMLSTSLLMGVFILMYHQRQNKMRVSWLNVIVFFVVLLTLNLIANLFRIIMLVIFKIWPDHFMHDTVGLITLGVYVLMPLYFSARWFVRRFGRETRAEWSRVKITEGVVSYGSITVLVLFATAIHLQSVRSQSTPVATTASFSGLQPVGMKDGITKFTNERSLIYVKPIPEFFSGEHTPLLCWRGSGYRFEKVVETVVEGRTIYTGVIRKGKDRLYTAWWYSNGDRETLSQWEWRWRMLRYQESFFLVNITSSSQDHLLSEVTHALKNRTFSIHMAYDDTTD